MYFVTDAWHPVQVNSTYLQGSCLAESAAQNISSATSQAIGSALAPKYGANACSNITSSGMDVTPAFWHASPCCNMMIATIKRWSGSFSICRQHRVSSIFCDLCTLHIMAYTSDRCPNCSWSQVSFTHDIEAALLNGCCFVSIKQWGRGRLALPSEHGQKARHSSCIAVEHLVTCSFDRGVMLVASWQS